MVQQQFSVKGMTCGNCAKHVEKALINLPGISGVQVDLDQNRVLLDYDPNLLNQEILVSAVSQAGYTLEGPVS